MSQSNKSQDLYAALGVPPDADAATIKKAHRRRARETHPDVRGGDREHFMAVQHAYDILSDEAQRKRYDTTGFSDAAPDPTNQATGELCQMVINLVAEHGAGFDVLSRARQKVMEQKDKAVRDICSALKQANEFEKASKNIKRHRKKQGENLFAGVLRKQADTIREMVDDMEQASKKYDAMMAILDDYRFETTSPVAFTRSGAGTATIQFDGKIMW